MRAQKLSTHGDVPGGPTGGRVIRIAAMVSLQSGFGQTLLTGCARWLSEFPRSGVWITKSEITAPRFDLSPYDGVLYHGGVPSFDRRIRRWNRPAINTSSNSRIVPPNSVLSDDRSAAQLAFAHFQEQGRNDLTVIAVEGVTYHRLRVDAFVEVAREAGMTPEILRFPRWPDEPGWNAMAERFRDRAGLTGVYTADNQLGDVLCRTLTRLGISVPDEVAVVGVGNETNLCEFSTPPLSSVDNAIDLRGYRAVAELVQQIRGKPPLNEPIFIQPRGIIVRHSSDLTATRDPDVRLAVRYIRDHADRSITIDAVVGHVSVSRRLLEQKFRRFLSRTIHEEIWRAHLQLARHMLINSGLPMYHVAARSGFGTLSNFSTLFRRATGMPPLEFRRRYRHSQ